MPFEQVPAAGASVTQAEYDMGMDDRPAITLSDIADERKHLRLLVYGRSLFRAFRERVCW